MIRNKKLRTVFCGILIFLLVFALFCLGDYGIRYYHTPIKKDYDYTGTGMLVSLTEPDTFEQVSVEIHGKALHYLWGNQEDAIAGNVWMNGERLFVEGADDIGFYAPFIDEEPYYSCLTESATNIPGNMFLISRDLKTVFCGVLMDGKEFLLIIPAENKSDADRTLKSGLEQSQPLSRWLSDYPLFV